MQLHCCFVSTLTQIAYNARVTVCVCVCLRLQLCVCVCVKCMTDKRRCHCRDKVPCEQQIKVAPSKQREREKGREGKRVCVSERTRDKSGYAVAKQNPLEAAPVQLSCCPTLQKESHILHSPWACCHRICQAGAAIHT